MMNMLQTIQGYLQTGWRYIRRISGDDAYERYLEHHRSAHSHETALSARQFYLWRLEQKSRGVTRCC